MRVASVIGQKVHGSAQPPAKKMAGQIEKETMKFHTSGHNQSRLLN